MQPEPISHPDRAAATLANVGEQRAAREGRTFAAPLPESRDCRIDLKLLRWQAERAAARSAAAQKRLADFAATERADLWAGTVQDGTARGFATALEEAVALAPKAPAAADLADDPVRTQQLTGKQLRTKKDLLVSSGGARIRFTRRDGLLYVDRATDTNSPNCLRFEARADHGTLDAFAGDPAVRPRLFSAQFLRPIRYLTAPGFTQLELAGRIGRGPIGWDATVLVTGRDTESTLQLLISIDNRVRDYRLRARFLGVPGAHLLHECVDVRETVDSANGGFVAFTLVRSCGRLLVDGASIAVPAAQCPGRIVHHFRLGSTTAAADG